MRTLKNSVKEVKARINLNYWKKLKMRRGTFDGVMKEKYFVY